MSRSSSRLGALPAAEAPRAPEATPRTGWSLAHFLLVCGDEVWGRRARDALRAEGFDVETTHDGTSVLARISTGEPDIVGIDLSLPDEIALTLCASIRSRAEVAIFAVGPRASEASILAALAAGADTVVPKEASARELVARVRALLRRFPASAP